MLCHAAGTCRTWLSCRSNTVITLCAASTLASALTPLSAICMHSCQASGHCKDTR